MIISIGVFSVLVITAIAITLSMANAQAKTANLQAVLDNIRFSLELITKELRTGTGYELANHCTAVPGAEIHFLSTDQTSPPRVYYLNGSGTIMRSKQTIAADGECGRAIPFTSTEVLVERLTFSLRGNMAGPNDGQPIVTVSLRVRAREPRFGADTNMNLQTTVAQRLRDL